jgi:hypothetical protein
MVSEEFLQGLPAEISVTPIVNRLCIRPGAKPVCDTIIPHLTDDQKSIAEQEIHRKIESECCPYFYAGHGRHC